MSATALDARAVLASRARTFDLASAFLPRSTRDDAAVVYTFCRAVDDAADEDRDRVAVSAIRDELLGGRAPRPVVGAFLEVAGRRGLPLSAALELVDGCASDLGRVRIADEAALFRYAYRVAGTVGLLMAPLLEGRGDAARRHAIDLGVAMQLTNIARDVAEDAALDRVYLPATWLREQGLHPDDVLLGSGDRAALAAVVRRLVDRAEVAYRSGEEGLACLPVRTRIAIGVAARVYRAIGHAVVRRGAAALEERTVLSLAERAWHAVAGALLAVRAVRR